MKGRTAPWSERYGGGWERVQRLVAASVAAREDSLQQEKEAFELHAKRREARLLAWGVFALLALAIVAIVLAVSAGTAKRTAEDERDKAKTAQAQQSEATKKQVEADHARVEADATARVALSNEAAAKLDKANQLWAFGDTLETTNQAIESAKVKIPEGNEALVELNQVQQTLNEQLVNVAVLAPRVYLQISEHAQRAAADRFASKVSRQSLGADPIKVIPADLHGYVRNELRCFRKAECEEAKQLLEVLNAQLIQPKLKLTDVSGTFEHSKAIRPRHYEVWFAPGEIRVAQ